jgi:hypothetical protein
MSAYLSCPVTESSHLKAFFSTQPSLLEKLYLRICCIPAASCEVERLFSVSGQVDSPRRTGLKSSNLASLVLLKKNSAVVEEFLQDENVRFFYILLMN